MPTCFEMRLTTFGPTYLFGLKGSVDSCAATLNLQRNIFLSASSPESGVPHNLYEWSHGVVM